MINHLDVLKVVHAGYSQQSGHTWGIEWFVKDLGEALVITFRGSDTARDWLRNFLAFPFRGRFAFTGHFGFVRAGERAIDAGLPLQIKRVYGKDKPIIFAGHSKGIESLPCALMFRDMGFNVKEWVGFGCPKIWLNQKPLPFPATLYAIEGDIVSMSPPWFRHRGEVVYLEKQVRTLFPSLINHKIELYIHVLEEQLKCLQ